MSLFPLKHLKARLQYPDSLTTDFALHEKYCHDATEMSAMPGALLFAQSSDDVRTAALFCSENRIPLVPRGAGTGLSGGCIASSDALLLSTEPLDSLHIDQSRRIAFCGPGLLTKKLLDEAAKYDLTYPPDPASYEESTLGGNVAENAGGLRCRRYGVTKDYVLGLRAVTVDGRELLTGVYTGNRGFALGDVIIASEGTLVIITEIAVRLVPTLGRGATILAAFDRPEDAATTVSDITSAGMTPTALEYIDRGAAAFSNAYEKTVGLDDVAAILLIETAPTDVVKETEAVGLVCNRNRCRTLRIESDSQKGDALWNVRRNVSKAVKQLSKLRISEDVAVPITRFPELVAFVAEMNGEGEVRISSYGHAGDGNLHVNFVSMSGSNKDRACIETGIDRLMEKTLQLGGTITGEHGIGLAKRKYLPAEFDSPTLAAMTAIKGVFDPSSLMNPGKIF